MVTSAPEVRQSLCEQDGAGDGEVDHAPGLGIGLGNGVAQVARKTGSRARVVEGIDCVGNAGRRVDHQVAAGGDAQVGGVTPEARAHRAWIRAGSEACQAHAGQRRNATCSGRGRPNRCDGAGSWFKVNTTFFPATGEPFAVKGRRKVDAAPEGATAGDGSGGPSLA